MRFAYAPECGSGRHRFWHENFGGEGYVHLGGQHRGVAGGDSKTGWAAGGKRITRSSSSSNPLQDQHISQMRGPAW